MRSDYLGACAQFRDLPERINTGLYLIPRMRRDQLEDAITGPAAVAGAAFSPPLVQRLLNDAGEDPDQLPVLQHALLRAWLNWKREGGSSPEIDFRHYDSTGGVRAGLDNHAEEIYDTLSDSDKRIAEILFRCLTERDPSNHDIRRPTELQVVAAIAGAPADEVRGVADRFREEGVWFLTPAAPSKLVDNTLLDITHESLIRKWYRLGGSADREGWIQQEADLREQYRELIKRARRALPKNDVLTGADLDAALEWRAHGLSQEWGLRYDPARDAFSLVSDYIERSETAHRNKLAELELDRRWTRATAYLTGIFVLGFFVLNYERPAVIRWIFDRFGLGLRRGAPSLKWSDKVVEGFLATILWVPYVLLCVVVANYGKQVHRRIVLRRIVEDASFGSRNLSKDNPAGQKTGDELALAPATLYATFSKRCLAYLIDLLIFAWEFVSCVLLNMATDNLHWTTPNDITPVIWTWFAADWLYQAFMIGSRWQATLGMRVAGIVVTDLDGRRVSFWRASARHFAKLLSYYSLIGMFLPLMTKRRQALHDFIARTVVLAGRPRPATGRNQ